MTKTSHVMSTIRRPGAALAYLTGSCLWLASGAAQAAGGGVAVKVANPLAAPRAAETITLNLADLRRLGPDLEPGKAVVTDDGGKPVLSQLVDVDGDEIVDELVFQVDLGPRATKVLTVESGQRRPPTREDYRVYGRFVRERHDDFAWENDRIARRAYGLALETWKREPLVSSGFDVWCKRTRRLVVNEWYMVDDYHRDNGEGGDVYSVGKSRGCGGSGVMVGDKLAVSRNFTSSRVLASGPIRLVFELGYPAFPAGPSSVSEVKRITLDAGKNFDKIESRYLVDGKPGPLTIGVGIAKHQGGTVEVDRTGAALRSWEPLKEKNGNLGCGVVLPPGAPADYKSGPLDHLLVRKSGPDGTFTHHAGFGWDRSGHFADAAAWGKTVKELIQQLASPVRVTMAASPPARGADRKTNGSGGSAAAPASTTGPGVAWARRTCDAVMKRTPTPIERWHYDVGLVLSGCESVWRTTGDRRYFDFIKSSVDRFVGEGGVIQGYDRETYNLDEINMGKVLFALLAEAKDPAEKERYEKALRTLRAQLAAQPRTADGGFWHKKIYPHQIWADGVYMAAPFLARFAAVFGDPAALDDAVKEVLLAETHLRDEKTGLLFHGWDERKTERWANPVTGRSSQLWARGVGWYAMAVVDVLVEMPRNDRRRGALVAVLRRLATAISRVQDQPSGVWWQVLDAAGRPGNFKEASASAMFAYALTKGVKHGWLDAKTHAPVAQRGYAGVLNQFVGVDQADPTSVHVKGICKVAGLGGEPYRDGSYEYYIGTEVVTDDPKGVGAFILASAEQG